MLVQDKTSPIIMQFNLIALIIICFLTTNSFSDALFFTQILTTVVNIPSRIARPFAAKGFTTATDALGSHVASTGGHLPLQAFSDEENMMKETGR